MVIVSKLTPGYFTEQVVLALCEGGSDAVLATTLLPEGRDAAARLLRLAGLDKRRRLRVIGPDGVRTHPWREVVRLAAGRLVRDEAFNDRVFHWMRDGFDAWVAGQMGPPVRMVYAHETECLETFRAARSAGVATVLDLPSPEHDYVENLLWNEAQKFPELLTSARRRFRELQAERTQRRHEEFCLADIVLANSELTARTWADAGLDRKKIRVARFGAPVPRSDGLDGGSCGVGPLRLVWAGTFSVRKGAHHLLEAWNLWNPGESATLDVFGRVRLPDSLVGRMPRGINLHGPVLQERLFEAFHSGDLLVFPTLCDGFGLVVTEALSCGLPVLTTPQAGASDLVRNGENGWLVAAAAPGELAAALAEAAADREGLRAMREVALATALAWQWSDYREQLRAVTRALW